MKKTIKKFSFINTCIFICTSAAVPTFVGNTSYSFSLKTTKSSVGSGAEKDDDERTAYLKVSKMSKYVTTNFRVRMDNDVEATSMQTISQPS